MLVNEMSGKTTLIAFAETPRALVLALVTGVDGVLAANGAATPSATVLPRTTKAPPALSSLRLAPHFPLRRIAISPVRRSNRAARKGYRR